VIPAKRLAFEFANLNLNRWQVVSDCHGNTCRLGQGGSAGPTRTNDSVLRRAAGLRRAEPEACPPGRTAGAQRRPHLSHRDSHSLMPR
jgi:hypothetical protein